MWLLAHCRGVSGWCNLKVPLSAGSDYVCDLCLSKCPFSVLVMCENIIVCVACACVCVWEWGLLLPRPRWSSRQPMGLRDISGSTQSWAYRETRFTFSVERPARKFLPTARWGHCHSVCPTSSINILIFIVFFQIIHGYQEHVSELVSRGQRAAVSNVSTLLGSDTCFALPGNRKPDRRRRKSRTGSLSPRRLSPKSKKETTV